MKRFGLLLCIINLWLVTGCGSSTSPGTSAQQGSNLREKPISVYNPQVAVPPHVRRPFPAITKFPVKSAKEATALLNPTELVIGVIVNGKARAYPINTLTGPKREILNDDLGGKAIAATW